MVDKCCMSKCAHKGKRGSRLGSATLSGIDWSGRNESAESKERVLNRCTQNSILTRTESTMLRVFKQHR